MDISIRERRHELLMAASFRVTVAFLRLWQSTLWGQVARDVCWQIYFICKRQKKKPFSQTATGFDGLGFQIRMSPWQTVASPLQTCIGDTVVLALPAHVIDNDHPDQRGSNHTAHNHNHHDSHRGPAVLVIHCTSIAIWGRWDAQVDVATLGSQRVGHDAGVFPHVSWTSVNYDQELIGCSKKVTLGEQQRPVVFGPVQARSWAATSDTLEHSRFTAGHRSVFQRSHEGRSFWRRNFGSLLCSFWHQFLYQHLHRDHKLWPSYRAKMK